MWKTRELPKFKSKLQALVKEHTLLEDEPLHLAVTYRANREHDDNGIFLLEVVGQLERHSLTVDPDLFEVTYESTDDYVTGFDSPLHLILTNESELTEAIDNDWPTAKEFTDAIQRGEFEIVYEDRIGKKIMKSIVESRSRRKDVARA